MLSLIFISTSLSLSLPQGLLESVCYIESKHHISAIHRHDGHGNSYGICQIKLSTAQSLGFTGTAEELMRPEVNIYYAGLYLKQQITRYHSIQRGVIAYNYGNAKSLTTTRYQRIVFKRWETQERSCNIKTPQNKTKIPVNRLISGHSNNMHNRHEDCGSIILSPILIFTDRAGKE